MEEFVQLGFERLALHSRSISFISPTNGEEVRFVAEYPADFEEAIKHCEK